MDWPHHSDSRDELLRDIINDVAGDDGGPRGSNNEKGPALGGVKSARYALILLQWNREALAMPVMASATFRPL